MKVSAAIALLSLGYLQGANAICNSGEVGIGRKQTYQWQGTNNVLVSDHWVIAANNCGDIGLSDKQFKGDPCSAGEAYGTGNGVNQCGSDGTPGFVWTKGGNFHNCYRVDQSCATGPFLYEPIKWCCQRW
ncbi:uncharacterized protein TRIVIDRAFT_69117 [Trichoderma virens Gv29-8]|uniref:Secreted protein n=1 Tax=Hypocrea virens (strain Gv29-8 / FGSC 10586) TaxID=413071 RepID=G9MYH0_HYPVG|nr:uncharacterized protein TRIVIDRAFT_69117 [Trichoderma virens Gv29-8]EHK20640.1 hypothetical protein TRIVIDRAFT_69117 [Trichoderma virens Gv29-8]UKZ53052.1 hypothetical protein TrVGV298_006839 [Trichoderma virens]UKZ78890.1 hypothetical protein TrVFT333_006636 [Trichoderma virens FT-333]